MSAWRYAKPVPTPVGGWRLKEYFAGGAGTTPNHRSFRTITIGASEPSEPARRESRKRPPALAAADYLRSGCLAGGPLLLPGNPLMFEASSAGFFRFASAADPTVFVELTAGPFLFPGWPAIPAPEFGALGAVETPGFVVCASAAGLDIASARPAMINVVFMTSPRVGHTASRACRSATQERTRAPHVPGKGRNKAQPAQVRLCSYLSRTI